MLKLIYKELSLNLGNSFHTEIMQPKICFTAFPNNGLNMFFIYLQLVHGR